MSDSKRSTGTDTLLQQARYFHEASGGALASQDDAVAILSLRNTIGRMLQHLEQLVAAGCGPAQVPGDKVYRMAVERGADGYATLLAKPEPDEPQQAASDPTKPGMVSISKLMVRPGETVHLPPEYLSMERHITNCGDAVVYLDTSAWTATVEPRPIPEDDLSALQKLCDALQPGPWELDDTDDAELPIRRVLDGIGVAEAASYPSGAFIAASREAVPKLIAEVRRLRAEVQQLAVRDFDLGAER